jgi:hypothetical protein
MEELRGNSIQLAEQNPNFQTSSWVEYQHKYTNTGISGPYGPLTLALAESWLATITRGFASLDLIFGALPPSHPLMVGTEAHANRQKAGDRSTYKQTNGWGQKNIQTNKRVGTEPHTNK